MGLWLRPMLCVGWVFCVYCLCNVVVFGLEFVRCTGMRGAEERKRLLYLNRS
jgi:hypothetical protein